MERGAPQERRSSVTVRPRMAGKEYEMTELERLDLAELACFHILSRAQTDPELGRLLLDTEDHRLLCAVEAAHDGTPLGVVLERRRVDLQPEVLDLRVRLMRLKILARRALPWLQDRAPGLQAELIEALR